MRARAVESCGIAHSGAGAQERRKELLELPISTCQRRASSRATIIIPWRCEIAIDARGEDREKKNKNNNVSGMGGGRWRCI